MKKKLLSLAGLFIIIISFGQATTAQQTQKKIFIKTEEVNIRYPINTEIVKQAMKLVNSALNDNEFKNELEKCSFVCTNRQDLCDSTNNISGKTVYEDFIKHDTLSLNLIIKKLLNPWKRHISGTLGETDPRSNTILTYTWWLFYKDRKELVINYATHIGHELFHTKYLGYIHYPSVDSRDFVGDRDVTYKIDEIIEKLIRKNYR